MKSPFFPFLISCCSFLVIISCGDSERAGLRWVKGELLFENDEGEDWESQWMLDGERSKVIQSDQGIELIAGAEARNDTCHTVLWTKQNFTGDICIEYDYTRTDTTTRYVTILYFFATGEGTAQYPTDISQWNEERVVPHMRTYFNHMHTYHISYAALTENGSNDYIRLRRYDPAKGGLKGTDIPDDYFQTGLFKKNVTYHIQVFKFGSQIEMQIQNKEDESDGLVCQWDVSGIPECQSGRIGLRHMYTRSARYNDFKVWRLQEPDQ